MQVYYPGDTITGTVTFTLTEPKCYESIEVNFTGNGHVEWTKVRKWLKPCSYWLPFGWTQTHFIGNEMYIQESLVLWTSQQSNGSSIGPGSFSFPFQFVIPFYVPTSFIYENIPSSNSSAHISYEIEARAVTGKFYVDYQDSVKINITRLTSINDANLATPVSLVKREQLGCLCVAAGNVEFVTTLPRTGYCVTNHDVIPLSVSVQNNSYSGRMIQMRVKILQKVSMFVRAACTWNIFCSPEIYSTSIRSIIVRTNRNYCWKTLAEIYSEPIQPGISYNWNPTNLTVPQRPPTLLGSRILRIEYILEVSAVIPSALNVICSARIPLFMGN